MQWSQCHFPTTLCILHGRRGIPVITHFTSQIGSPGVSLCTLHSAAPTTCMQELNCGYPCQNELVMWYCLSVPNNFLGGQIYCFYALLDSASSDTRQLPLVVLSWV